MYITCICLLLPNGKKKHVFPLEVFTVSSYISGEMVSDNI
jgi:hypothetical protein